MVYRCTETFETREGGYPFEVEEGSRWMRVNDRVANGGYELVVLMGVDWQGPNGAMATVRHDRLYESFEPVSDDDILWPEPFKEES